MGEAPFSAVMVMGYKPPVPTAGVPERTPDVLSVTPLGSGPVSLKIGAGVPEAVTVKEPAVPAVNVVLLALVKAGGASIVTVSVFEFVELTPAPLALTWFVAGPVAFDVTFTSIVRVGYELLSPIAESLVQVTVWPTAEQFQFVPEKPA